MYTCQYSYVLAYSPNTLLAGINIACDRDCYNSNTNPFAEEASKRKADTSEEYLKWKFSKVEGKKGLYFEYKAVPTENTLVIP